MRYPKRSQYRYAKSSYRIRNWPEYEAGLRRRGDLSVCADSAYDREGVYEAVHALGQGRHVRVLNTTTGLGTPDSYRVA